MKVDEEFRALCPPLTADERQRLENSIHADGCMSPVIVWDQKDILLDGHNRKEICEEMGIEFPVKRLQFNSRGEAFNWIICNQLSRRNLTPDQKRLLIGMRYNAEKKAYGQHGELHQNDEAPKSTAERIAKETGVSKATVERAGKAVSEMSEHEKADIMAGKKKISKPKNQAIREQLQLTRADGQTFAEEENAVDDWCGEIETVVRGINAIKKKYGLGAKSIKKIRTTTKNLFAEIKHVLGS